jgi:hypothetical protein
MRQLKKYWEERGERFRRIYVLTADSPNKLCGFSCAVIYGNLKIKEYVTVTQSLHLRQLALTSLKKTVNSRFGVEM